MKNLSKTYRLIAEAVPSLISKIGAESKRVPIGLDGAVIEHLFVEYCDRYGVRHSDWLDRTVEVTSHYNQCDKNKLFRIFEESDTDTIYAVDLGTNTDTLGKMLKDLSREFFRMNQKYIPIDYTAIFDPKNIAAVRVYDFALPEEERIKYLQTIEHVKALFYDEDGNWRKIYNLSHKTLHENPHVLAMERFL